MKIVWKAHGYRLIEKNWDWWNIQRYDQSARKYRNIGELHWCATTKQLSVSGYVLIMGLYQHHVPEMMQSVQNLLVVRRLTGVLPKYSAISNVN